MICTAASCTCVPRVSLKKESGLTALNHPLRAERMVCFHVFTKISLRQRRGDFFPLSFCIFQMVGLLLRFPAKTEDVSQLQISAEVIFRSSTELILLSEKLLRIPVRGSRHSVGARRHVVGASGVGFVGVCRKTFITLRVTRRKCIETFLRGCTDLSHDYIKLKRKWGAHFG